MATRSSARRRGIALNARDAAVVDSYLSDFKEVGADSQAIAGWNGPGPFRIANNYLEAAGENIMFGGADPTIPDLVPSDIEIVHNHLAKPLRWKKGDPSFEGVEWTVKNLFELKNARRVLVDGNLLEYNWPQAQNGFAILFTVRNQDGGAPWSTIEDVTFTNNLVRHVAAGINMLGRDDNHPSQQARRIAIRNNLFLDVGGTLGRRAAVSAARRHDRRHDRPQHRVPDRQHPVRRRSCAAHGVRLPEQRRHAGRERRDRIGHRRRHGRRSRATFRTPSFRRNVIVGGMAGRYPADNFFPASLQDAGLTIPRDEDFRLTLARPYSAWRHRRPRSGRRRRCACEGARWTARLPASGRAHGHTPTSWAWRCWPAVRPRLLVARLRCSSTYTSAIPIVAVGRREAVGRKAARPGAD